MRRLQNQFMQFLDNNDLYDDYCHNLWRERKMGFKELIDNEVPRFWMDNAFIWPKDEEDYWELANKKWKLELLELLRDT